MEVSTHKSHPAKKSGDSKTSSQKPSPRDSQGLCVNCSNLESCTLPSCGQSILMHCEEFHCEGGDCGTPTSMETRPAKSAGVSEPEGLKGLCVNCEERFDCTYTKSPGGVWHCAEYK